MPHCKTLISLLAVLTGAFVCPPVHAQLSFKITSAADTDTTALAGFQRAAANWSSLFADPITVNLNFSFTSAGFSSANIIGQTQSTENVYHYSAARSALLTDARSTDDAVAVSHLQTDSSFYNMLTNRTSNSPIGANSDTPFLDNNNNGDNFYLQMTNANAKALGLLAGNASAVDANITFNSAYSFDFYPDDGINGSQVDFVGVATHEIGHALGFESGVDILDYNASNKGISDNSFYFSPLDLYRYSARSINGTYMASQGGTVTLSAANSVPDLSADTQDKYFSLDGGVTNIALFSTGQTFGDKQQASHWKDNLNLGIMDPTAAYGERLTISQNDIRAFDVIGYNLAPTPEPSAPTTLAGGALGLIGLIAARRQRRTAKDRHNAQVDLLARLC